jgi:DNA mismatch repair protein MutS
VNGRHPVVEKMSSNGRFIPNDTILNHSGEQLLLITGPNMGGKSTYLRQVALIVLMAQVGSFVPAESAEICLVDRIFTRVGASDNLVRGQSTFMVEMQETANILEAATEKSLVILDEIGRGTSTYDGMSIAWAIMEYLHDKLKAQTLFATHYHELISLADKLEHAANYSVAVKDDPQDGVVFLYKILRGGVDKSYGIEVAKLAGLPSEVIAKARKILVDLEEGVLESGIQHELQTTRPTEGQTTLFEREHSSLKEVADEVQKIDVNTLTPMDALQKLHQLKTKLNQDHANN